MPRHEPGQPSEEDARAARNRTANDAMTRYQAGDAHAFNELFALVAPRILAYASRRLRDCEAAQDVVQAVFLRMHLARARYEPDRDVTAWAFAIARRILIDDFRQARRRAPFAPEDAGADVASSNDDPERILQAQQTLDQMRRTLHAIPDPQRRAFELVRFDEVPVRDAARRLATTEASVKKRAQRAADVLRGFALEGWALPMSAA